MAKKAFDLSRDSIYVADPNDLCIVGGSVLPNGERGPLDTIEDATHPLHDGNRLRGALDESFIANVDHYGVIQPITIAKKDDVPVVVAGRTRVRAARIVNERRKARGEPPITVRCAMRRADDNGLTGAMLSENSCRREDGVLEKMAKAKSFLARGVDESVVAATMNVSVGTLRAWLTFDDNATDETKIAAATHRIGPSAAAILARIKDPRDQSAMLAKLLSAPGKKTAAAARKVVATASGKAVALSKRSTSAVLEVVTSTTHPQAGEKTLAWWDGFEVALRVVLGESVSDQRVTSLLEKAGL